MYKTTIFQKNVLIFGIPLLIIGLMIFIAKSSLFQMNPNNLAIGITFDLLLIVPFVYFLLIRKTTIPKTTILPFLILGIVICSIILPLENQQYLIFFKSWILPIVELFVLAFVIYNLRKAIKIYKQKKGHSIDFFTVLKNTCYEILPKMAVIPVVTEIAVIYYGFIHWKKRKLQENEFSYHKDSGTITLLGAIIFLIAIETFALHLVLAKYSNIVAWILTILSIYSGFQLFGFLKSMLKRPISIANDKLFLRYGIMNETSIDLKHIDSIEIFSKDIELNNETRKLSFFGGLESHNVMIRLKKEATMVGLYGIKKTYTTLVLHVDNKANFVDSVNAVIENS